MLREAYDIILEALFPLPPRRRKCQNCYWFQLPPPGKKPQTRTCHFDGKMIMKSVTIPVKGDKPGVIHYCVSWKGCGRNVWKSFV